MTIFDDSRNPLGGHLHQYLLKDGSLRHAIMAIGSIQESFCNKSDRQDAWNHRATAYRLLRSELNGSLEGLEALYTIILLGLTEVCFI